MWRFLVLIIIFVLFGLFWFLDMRYRTMIGESIPDQTQSAKGTIVSHNQENSVIPIESGYSGEEQNSRIVLMPAEHGVYHGAFPDFGPEEDIVSAKRIRDFKTLVDKDIVWAYFSNNWFDGIHFPKNAVEIISQEGNVPFIRMMPRSDWYESSPEPIYALERIENGYFDEELRQWFKDAKTATVPLLVEFGTEVNGDWFSWNAKWNGEKTGAEQFKKAYRHIIDISREEGAYNITWFFHVDAQGEPEKAAWNAMTAYYPGDDYIDWLGISVYGAQEPGDDWQSFIEVFDSAYDEFSSISATKPLAILEFGVNEHTQKAVWISEALQAINGGRYPRIKAVSYWHSNWQNDNGIMSKLRIDSSQASLVAYTQKVRDPFFIVEPIFKEQERLLLEE